MANPDAVDNRTQHEPTPPTPTIGGDFVAGDNVAGDKVMGDKVVILAPTPVLTPQDRLDRRMLVDLVRQSWIAGVLLQRVGGRWRFVHRLLQEHLAAAGQESGGRRQESGVGS
jgi:hypothetical protein